MAPSPWCRTYQKKEEGVLACPSSSPHAFTHLSRGCREFQQAYVPCWEVGVRNYEGLRKQVIHCHYITVQVLFKLPAFSMHPPGLFSPCILPCRAAPFSTWGRMSAQQGGACQMSTSGWGGVSCELYLAVSITLFGSSGSHCTAQAREMGLWSHTVCMDTV